MQVASPPSSANLKEQCQPVHLPSASLKEQCRCTVELFVICSSALSFQSLPVSARATAAFRPRRPRRHRSPRRRRLTHGGVLNAGSSPAGSRCSSPCSQSGGVVRALRALVWRKRIQYRRSTKKWLARDRFCTGRHIMCDLDVLLIASYPASAPALSCVVSCKGRAQPPAVVGTSPRVHSSSSEQRLPMESLPSSLSRLLLCGNDDFQNSVTSQR